MVDLIGDIVDFFIRSVIVKIIGYFLFLAFILALFIEIAFFKATGHIDFTIFFNKEILGELALYYKKEIALLGIAITLFYMSLALYLQNKIAKRKNCAIQEVELKQIAKIWLESESYKELIKAEVMEEAQTETPKETKPEFIIPSFKNPRSYELFDFINKNKEAFSYDGVSIITDLIKILENNPTSSVASKFTKDPNYKDYKKLVIANKTSYDILSEIDLYTHTFNVVDEAIRYIEEKYPKEKKIYLQRAIIAALAHDIGKIQVPLTEAVTYDLFKKAPHNVISALILREKYPELDKDTIEAVEQHHGAIKNKNNFILKILLEADKKAREKEINKWLVDNKIIKNRDEKSEMRDEEERSGDEVKEIRKGEAEKEDKSKDEVKEEKEEIKSEEAEEKNGEAENSKEEIKEEEEVFDIDMDECFGEEEMDYEGMKEEIRKEIEGNLCNVKATSSGLDFNSLVFAKGNKIYISYAYLNTILQNNTKDFIKSLAEHKEGYSKTITISAFDREYKVILIVIDDKALGLDVSNVNCDEVEIEEGE